MREDGCQRGVQRPSQLRLHCDNLDDENSAGEYMDHVSLRYRLQIQFSLPDLYPATSLVEMTERTSLITISSVDHLESKLSISWSPQSSIVLQSNKSQSTTSPLPSPAPKSPSGSNLTLLNMVRPAYHSELALHLLNPHLQRLSLSMKYYLPPFDKLSSHGRNFSCALYWTVYLSNQHSQDTIPPHKVSAQRHLPRSGHI
ncbi:hypothetical protein DEU56DRAFT_902144 [Suillus clintonianus]|uniref:uncharacterized protein n=1 Tax=Suillus clintonianus TaxID=1904413 RepID=UPI001B862D84|nr:uncharacterized protein DEU56DRAFT_902144 [Suillus clintonianus]KAG2133755.1 hypothetical protein DEU56DRAFT_902144 [Suillus clintonianus]